MQFVEAQLIGSTARDSFVVWDHGSGEIAGFIAVEPDKRLIGFYHCKGSGADHPVRASMIAMKCWRRRGVAHTGFALRTWSASYMSTRSRTVGPLWLRAAPGVCCNSPINSRQRAQGLLAQPHREPPKPHRPRRPENSVTSPANFLCLCNVHKSKCIAGHPRTGW